MTDRVRSRIDRLDLVFSDYERSREVKRIYSGMEELVLAYEERRVALVARIIAAEGDDAHVEAEVDRAFETARREAHQLMTRYVEAQLELRRHLTSEEFAIIDGLR
jgi:hypothetical protein